MDSGKLNRRIELQSPTHTLDAMGSNVTSWAMWAEPWAMVEYKGGGETFDAERRVAVQNVEITIRYRAGVTPEMRVKLDGKDYKIHDVAEIERREFLLLRCSADDVSSGV